MRHSTRTTLVRSAALAIGAMVAVVGIGACTGSGGGGASSAMDAAGGAGGAGATAASAPGAAARPGAATGKADSAQSVGDLDLGSAKIRIAEMHVAVKHGESIAAKANAAALIAAQTGGSVDADDRASGKYPSASLILRVPPEDLTAVLTRLSQLGTEKSRHLSTQDVTSKVADVNSRVNSARGAIVRLRDLYQHAVKVADVIEIESELSSRESDLESLQAQQRALTAQTSMATITLTLTTAAVVAKPPAKHHDDRSGFLGGLHNGWDAFSRGAAAVATAAGAVLPFAILLLALALIGRVLWPRLRPVRPSPPAPAPPQ
jgi:hypothetical protein